MVTESKRGSEALIREWALKDRQISEDLISRAAELLEDWKIRNIYTHGIPPVVDHVLIEFEGRADEDDYERCGNIIRRLGDVTPHGPGVPISLRILINGIPPIDLLPGELELGTR
jgi:hypothetical protein